LPMRVLAISGHPDDETLGCGGTLLRHRADGDEVYWVIATQATEPRWQAETVRQKATEVEQVAQAYAMSDVHRLGFPAAMLDVMPHAEVVEALCGVVAKVRPDVVYVVHGGDIHTDHRIVFDASIAALKSHYMKRLGVTRVASYETLSSTDAAPPLADRTFAPSIYRDVTEYLEQKLAIMAMYESELQPFPMPRALESVRALARCRGATVGVAYAEAFMLIRELT